LIIFIINAIKIIFLLGFLILIHEGGHFLAAKLCKVKVNEFSIGFGPNILTKKGKETVYSLRLIPLGGFVNMLGEEERSEEEGSFSKISIPKRVFIVLAGGITNIVFGLIIYFVLVSFSTNHVSTIVEKTIPEYGNNISLIQPDDEIIKINNKKIKLKTDIDEVLEKSNGEELNLEIKRENKIENINITPVEKKEKSTGIYLSTASSEEKQTQIVKIDEGSNAQKQGLLLNDIILKIDGEEVQGNIQKVRELIAKESKENIIFLVDRNNEEIEIEVTPEYIPIYYLGLQFKVAENNFGNNVYYGFWDTIDFSFSIIDNLKMLFTGNVGVDQMMGPVGISNEISRTDNVKEFITLLALVSLSLGVTNLIPFPPLDGGKVLIFLIEAIKRKPLDQKIENSIQLAGFILLILLSIYITYNDILRIF